MGSRGIRSRLLISLLLMAAVVLGLALPLANGVIESRFSAFELGKARDDADRLQLLMIERIDRLRTHAVDYSNWSETADFVRGARPDYVADNFDAGALVNLGADHVFVLNGELDVRFAGSLKPGANGEPDRIAPFVAQPLAALLAAPRVRAALEREQGIGFYDWLDGRWYAVGVAAIVDPNAASPGAPLGVVGFASELNAVRLDAIARTAKIPVVLVQTTSFGIGSQLEGSDVFTRRPVTDTDGKASAWIDIHYPRPLLEQTRVARQLMLAMSVGIFLVGSLLVWWLVDRGLISRLERMQAELQAMTQGERDALSASRHGDEMDTVAERINRLYAEVKLVSGQWRHEAMHDALTGLGNRSSLLQTLHARLAGEPQGGDLALLLVDLDGFKAINDLFGHAMGDHVLVQVAACLRQQFGDDATCFRLGGDEFAVLAVSTGPHHALSLAERANRAIASLEMSGMTRGILGASSGVSVARSGEGDLSADQMLQRADVALYSVKRHGRNGHALFDDAMLKEMLLQNELLRSLDHAIGDGALEAWYQPIVASSDHRVQRLEVLARWRHPQLGWIDPARFVAVAEINNLAASLDIAILQRALRAWPALSANCPDIALSVNVSAQSLLDDQYLRTVVAMLSDPAHRGMDLTLEITETAFTNNEQALIAPVTTLKAMGVQIVLDDFGVGYSSLARLADIQPRGIKLDGSFVRGRGQGGDRICRAVIALAHEFNIGVTAEWIESEEDAQCLRDWHCDSLQGYYFAAPMALDDAVTWLAAQKAAV